MHFTRFLRRARTACLQNDSVHIAVNIIPNLENHNMDGLQIRDEAVRDRIRLAEEFLDPGMFVHKVCRCVY